ncbi:ankyrin [Myriangium duriaei CBS 260.36]|uniref:Ankyrin n=1 Tax=Myriangium duriaei CBS 260.36 TaxID=1168546 RepID=A0A9P4MFV1_9PEZI|nr:ankyrin [Myriangium duriaei CBS 260.36]
MSFYGQDKLDPCHQPRLVPPLPTVLCAAARNGQSSVLRFFFDKIPACRDNPLGEPWNPSIHVHEQDIPTQWSVDSWPNMVSIAAVQSSKPEVFQTLLTYGMNVQTAPERWVTPFEVALERHDFTMARFLLSQGASIYGNGGALGNTSSLRDAAKYDDIDSLRFLLEHGAKLDGTNALQGSAESGCVRTAEFLLEAGVNIDEIFEQVYYERGAEVESRCSALHTAIRWKQADFVHFLLLRGANVNVQDGIHQTPVQLAERMGEICILELLQQAQ